MVQVIKENGLKSRWDQIMLKDRPLSYSSVPMSERRPVFLVENFIDRKFPRKNSDGKDSLSC